jgi:hypothetical protein
LAWQGWHPACYRSLLDSNCGFLEHHETFLTHREDCDHKVTPNKSVAQQLPPSARKTGMLDTADSFVLDETGLRSLGCQVTEATKKGTETMIYNVRRALQSSSETANCTFIDGFSDAKSGSHYFSKTNLCVWTLTETIASATGTGQTIIPGNTYSFTSRMLGQNECTEAFMAPNAQGCHKRYDYEPTPDGWAPDARHEALPHTDCKNFIKDYHSWMASHCMQFKKKLLPDGYGLSVYQAAWSVVTEWLEEHPDCNAFFRMKLLFFRSDFLRQARCVMRKAQYIMLGDSVAGGNLRSAMNCDECIVALWRVRRQWHIHCGFYRFVMELRRSLPTTASTFGDLLVRNSDAARARPLPALSAELTLQAAILKDTAPTDLMSVASLRLQFKNRKAEAFSSPLADKLVKAMKELVRLGLLVEVETEQPVAAAPSQEEPDRKRQKRPITTRGAMPGSFKKVPSNHHSAAGKDHREALRVGLESFPEDA